MIGRKLRAKKVNEGIEMPRYAHEGDAGLDLRITETVTLEPMQKCVVGCGLAVEIPSGCVGLVFPRSGLAAKQGITLSNSVGVIDSGYRGEVCAALITRATRQLRSKLERASASLSLCPMCRAISCRSMSLATPSAALAVSAARAFSRWLSCWQ